MSLHPHNNEVSQKENTYLFLTEKNKTLNSDSDLHSLPQSSIKITVIYSKMRNFAMSVHGIDLPAPTWLPTGMQIDSTYLLSSLIAHQEKQKGENKLGLFMNSI